MHSVYLAGEDPKEPCLHKFEDRDAAFAFSTANPGSVIYQAEKWEKALERRSLQRSGRVGELMLEHNCSRVWAYELLRRERDGRPLDQRCKFDQRRLMELMVEHQCTRPWAYHLLKQEAEARRIVAEGGEAPSAKARGPKPKFDQARLRLLISERHCSIGKAYQLLKEEAEAARIADAGDRREDGGFMGRAVARITSVLGVHAAEAERLLDDELGMMPAEEFKQTEKVQVLLATERVIAPRSYE